MVCICTNNILVCRHADPLGSDSDDEDGEPPLTPHGDHTSAPSSRPSKHASCNRTSLPDLQHCCNTAAICYTVVYSMIDVQLYSYEGC